MLGRMLRFIRSILIFAVILLVFLEAASLFYLHIVNTSLPRPTYSLVNTKSAFWRNINEHFGIWREPGSTYLHRKECFVVRYHANEFGMRDVSRNLVSAQARAVVLGDSFMEGWGLELEDRLSNLLEQRMGKEFLNFGTSGGFGTIQEWLLYKHLAKRFGHEVILWAILPLNDFKDNDARHSRQYRPFLKGQYPNYTLAYSRETLPPPPEGIRYLFRSIDATLREWSGLYQVLRHTRSLFREPRWMDGIKPDDKNIVSMFHDFSDEDWLIMRYTVEQLVEEADGRSLIVFTIPCYPDFLRYERRPTPLEEKFQALSAEFNFVYVDLLAAMHKEDPSRYASPCDMHWNAYANEAAAQILLPHLEQAFAKAGSQHEK